LVQLSKNNIVLPNPEELPRDIWRKKGILYPYFKDALGAADCTHILAKVSSDNIPRFRNRKGEISQNVLAMCTFGLFFACVIPGWEGSVHDGRVLQWALQNGLEVPEGKYFLVDAGYALRKGFLAPYRGVRYHLREQAISKLRFVYIFYIIFIFIFNITYISC